MESNLRLKIKRIALVRKLVFILLIFSIPSSVFAQYYIRGEVKDEKDNALQNVKIILHSTGIPYASGIGGAFGILTSQETDSLSFMIDGYEPYSVKIKTTQYLNVVMKMLPFTASLHKKHLISLTRNLGSNPDRNNSVADETYNGVVPNEFLKADRYPVTGLTLNIDRASYSNVRRFINMNSVVPFDAVRIEEMLNYFNLHYSQPKSDSLFEANSHLTGCPWNDENQLLFLQVNSKKINLDKIPPSNLVFLIDVSGSMDMPNRLPLLKAAFRKLVENLRPIDTVSIVVYGGVVGVMLQPTSGANKQKIIEAIEDLNPAGFTPGEAGIRQAYRLAQSKFIKGGNNRVIIATDGDFNIGQTSEQELEDLIVKMKQTGIYLTCLGVGMGNYKDSKIEVLAKKGNGNFAYLDDEKEAEKVLVKELTQTLYAVADDVYMNVSFDPTLVNEYRLIGFDNKRTALADSSLSLEGGEVGSGHSLMAIFEIVPSNKNNNAKEDNLRDRPIATINLHYRLPGKKESRFFNYKCPFQFQEFDEADPYIRFATSVAMFGSLLRECKYIKKSGWEELLMMTKNSMDETDPLEKEFYDLIVKARKVYTGVGKKKKKGE